MELAAELPTFFKYLKKKGGKWTIQCVNLWMASKLLQWDLFIYVCVQPPVLQFGKSFGEHIFVRLMDVEARFSLI